MIAINLKLNKVFNQDCIYGMNQFPNNIADLILTDPPFGIKFQAKRSNYNRDDSLVLEGYQEPENYFDFSRAWINQAARLLKEDGSMYIFSGYNNLKDILYAVEEAGLVLVQQLIWQYNFGVFTKSKWTTSHYNILYICKNEKKRRFYRQFSDPKKHYHDIQSVIKIPREYWTGETKVPTKLPMDLVVKLLTYSSKENDVVLDPFLGSGQVAVAAKSMNRKYIGFEIVKDYYDFILERL